MKTTYLLLKNGLVLFLIKQNTKRNTFPMCWNSRRLRPSEREILQPTSCIQVMTSRFAKIPTTRICPFFPGSQADEPTRKQEYLPLKLLIINQSSNNGPFIYNGPNGLPEWCPSPMVFEHSPGLQGEYSISGHLPFAFGKHFFLFLQQVLKVPLALVTYLASKLIKIMLCVIRNWDTVDV